MLQHWYIFSVRSSEIYSTGEVSFHAEGASDQYFLGTQYLPPRWPTLSISTSILFNSCAVSYIKYDCWKRGGFICSSDFEMRVYLLRGKFETVEVLFATRKLSRSLFLSQCNVGKLLLFWEIILHQNLTTNTKKYNIQTFILCAIGTQWILRGGHMQTFDGLQMATVEEQKKSWLARLADTFLISFLCLSKF